MNAAVTGEGAADLAYQREILPKVSRTFALTIPQLPNPLSEPIGNAYLLCRIADTVEDEPALSAQDKQAFLTRFIEVVEGRAPAPDFAGDLGPLLSAATIEAERELVANTPKVIRVTHRFRPVQREALERCVRIMSLGMAEFQRNATPNGLNDVPALNRYCYHVAGVVGETITKLLCDYSPRIGERREELFRLSTSFGQGLQMVNILKDMWDDRRRGVCWLPRDVFLATGSDLSALASKRSNPQFVAGLLGLVGMARDHLLAALRFTLLIPARETGIRRFLLWALGMAVLTLRRINAHPDFTDGDEVKISRQEVRSTVLVTSALARSDQALKLLFNAVTRALPSETGHLAAKA